MSNNSSVSIKIGDAAKILGVSIKTLRRWEQAGKISSIRTPGGTRLYSLSELHKINPQSQSLEETSKEYSLPKQTNWRTYLNITQTELPQIVIQPTSSSSNRRFPFKTVSLFMCLLVVLGIGSVKLLNLYQNDTASFKQTGFGANVLAESTVRGFLEVNGDVDIKGALTTESINGLTLTGEGSSLIVVGTVTLNQALGATSSPTFAALNLTDLLDLGSLAADPTTANNGQTYYNTTSNKFRCYINGSWSNCDTVIQILILPIPEISQQSQLEMGFLVEDPLVMSLFPWM